MSSPQYVRGSYFGRQHDDDDDDDDIADDTKSNTTDEETDLVSYHLQALTKARSVKQMLLEAFI